MLETQIGFGDIEIAVSVGAAKLAYAKIGASARMPHQFRKFGAAVRRATGGVVLGTGVFLIAKSP